MARRALWLAVVGVVALGSARAQSPSEYELKAAYLYNFGKYVTWPPEALDGADKPFAICVLGADPFGDVLDETVQGRQEQGKRIVVLRIDSAKKASACHILFVGASEAERTADVLRQLDHLPVLTVGDFDGFANRGGMIQFVREGSRIRFDINARTAGESHLSISSQLLKLARTVIARGP